MIASVLALLAATSAAQATDTTRSAREAFTLCLRTYVNQSIDAHMAVDAFHTAYPQQCTQQEAAFRAAVMQRETSMRATRANAQDTARMEVEDARTNFNDRFEAAMTPQPSPSS